MSGWPAETRAAIVAALRAQEPPYTVREATRLARVLEGVIPAVPPRKRPKREVETPEHAAMMARMIRAHGRRVADADPEDLETLLGLQAVLDAAVAEAIAGQRKRWGRSWADIGRAAGTTRQAAQQRWGSVAS